MKKLGFIGFGNMASAIALGILESKFLKPEQMMIYDIAENAKEKARIHHIEVADSENEVVNQSEMIIIGVKPQVVESVIQTIKDDLKEKTIVSIVLSYDYEKYQSLLHASTHHLTIMPNTPVQVLEGMILLEDKHSLTDEELCFVKDMFNSVGEVEIVPSHLMGVAGTLSGCSPAFLYMVIEALADGAVKEGLPRALAYKLASQTVAGAGKMQLKTQMHPGILKDNVCSPGGSTIKGVEALEKGNIRASFMDAIEKATHYK